MNTLRKIQTARKLSSLQSIELAINDACMTLGVEQSRAYFITLAISELASNMIRHGCSNSTLPDELFVEVLSSSTSLKVVMADGCDPLPSDIVNKLIAHDGTIAPFDTTICNLPESGWGLDLIHSAAESVAYRRKKQQNVYEVAFELESSNPVDKRVA